MWTIIRFQAGGDALFPRLVEPVVAHFSGSAGCLRAELVRNMDDEDLWAIVTEWDAVGSYRRAMSGDATKMLLVPVLSLALDEPSAYQEFA